MLNADASLRIARVERDPPAYVRGLRRDDNSAMPWRTTVGEIEQYRAAYRIDSDHPLGVRPGYIDLIRAEQYRQLEQGILKLRPAHARDHTIDMGIEL